MLLAMNRVRASFKNLVGCVAGSQVERAEAHAGVATVLVDELDAAARGLAMRML